MRLGIISDIHLEFAHWDFTERKDVDLYICAGDIATENRSATRAKFLAKHPDIFYIYGNHDYYCGEFSEEPIRTLTFDGVKIVGATLWTDLTNPLDWLYYQTGMNDALWIDGLVPGAYQQAHHNHLKFLTESDADVIVSHHLPSFQSVPEEYKGSTLNAAFATELSEVILGMKKPPRLWVHGHTHTPFDYMIGETRVICHPRGYPHQELFNNYEPMVVEV
jgi:predicted phosphodiesterase